MSDKDKITYLAVAVLFMALTLMFDNMGFLPIANITTAVGVMFALMATIADMRDNK